MTVALGLAAPAPAWAGRPGRSKPTGKTARRARAKAPHRIVTARGLRLRNRRKQTLAAVGNFQTPRGRSAGTAFVVQRSPDGTALVLTNHHVAFTSDGRPIKGTVQFQVDGDSRKPVGAPVVRVVRASKRLDYALVRVELPTALSDVAPVRLAPRAGKARNVYSGGFANVWRRKTLPIGPRQQSSQTARLARQGRIRPMLEQTGAVVGNNGDLIVELANDVGSSGSPIVSKRSNRVVGVLYAGEAGPRSRQVSFAIPIERILRDLSSSRARLSGSDRAAVDDLLRETRR